MQNENAKKGWKAWSEEEQAIFRSLYHQYQKRFELYTPQLSGRTLLQIKSYYYNIAKREEGDRSHGERIDALGKVQAAFRHHVTEK